MSQGRIALMGSGELTSSMVEVHKELLSSAGKNHNALFLDTPAGFQPNADDISRKAKEFFAKKVQQNLEIASYKSAENISDYDHQLLLQQLDAAGYLLVGPGSPTYLVRQLQQGPIVKAMANIVHRGGSLVVASAAALTAGQKTLPVYEIYKVGLDLYWEEGLDLMAMFDLNMVVIPHWNNAEGGSHDTRFCYMGQDRFARLKALLPPQTMFVGLDEHTACVIDFSKNIATVRGQGGVTLQQHGKEMIMQKGESIDVDIFRKGLAGRGLALKNGGTGNAHEQAEEADCSYWDMVRSIENTFNTGLAQMDFRETANALLSLDDHLVRAQVNRESDEDIAQTREMFRELIIRLGVELQEARRNQNLLTELIKGIMKLRGEYKKQKMWAEADALREVLDTSGVIVADTSEGSTWKIHADE